MKFAHELCWQTIVSITQNCTDQFTSNVQYVLLARNYKIRLRFHKAISIKHQANGNVQFFGPPGTLRNNTLYKMQRGST